MPTSGLLKSDIGDYNMLAYSNNFVVNNNDKLAWESIKTLLKNSRSPN
jgi:hypothetical protein